MTMITDMRQSPVETLPRLHFGLYGQAQARGLSLTEHLREADPDDQYPVGSEIRKMGPVGRILKEAKIRLRSQPRRGIQASTYEEWHNNSPANVLIPEFFVRTSQAAIESYQEREDRRLQELLEAQAQAVGRALRELGEENGTRAILGSTDALLGSALRPYADNATVEWSTQVAPAIPLSELIASEVGITGDSYRTTRLTRVAADLRVSRIAEGAEIPRMRVVTSDQAIPLYKYGLGVEWTYEVLRRMRLDEVGRITAEIAVQQEVDKVTAAADIIYNGDGTTNSAAEVFNLTTLDSTTTANNLTLAAWVAFKMKFAQPYTLTTALGTEAAIQKLLLLNTGSANMPLVMIQAQSGLGSFTAINPGLRDNVAIGWTADVTAGKVLGFDRRRTLRRVFETASQIREIERFVLRQTEVFVMTENEAFAVQDPDAAKILNLAA